MSAAGDSTSIVMGAGRLYYAAADDSRPTDASTLLSAVAGLTPIALGYTTDGNDVTVEPTTEQVMAAEILDPVLMLQTARRVQLTANAMESRMGLLHLALGSGVVADTAPSLTLPPVGEMTPVMLIWDSEDPDSASFAADNRRRVFYQAYATGNVQLRAQKAPNISTVPMTFTCIHDETAGQPFDVFPNAAGLF